jgi:histidine triad (HIT) family protein
MCIFCKIVKDEIPSYKVYEDDKCLAFLDISPVAPGHTLLIPKKHYEMMSDTPDELVSYLYTKAKELMIHIKKELKADFVVLSVVGFEVPHFHIHLIPRRTDDGLFNFWPTRKYKENEAEDILKKIKLN